jgi:hypothetical protein
MSATRISSACCIIARSSRWIITASTRLARRSSAYSPATATMPGTSVPRRCFADAEEMQRARALAQALVDAHPDSAHLAEAQSLIGC